VKCPHCDCDGSKVTETRKQDGAVWRRHKCFGCDATFVSQQQTSADMRMPPNVWADRGLSRQSGRRKADPRAKETTTGAHLQSVWQ
jgi:transcriptional regulator NrdR family protein